MAKFAPGSGPLLPVRSRNRSWSILKPKQLTKSLPSTCVALTFSCQLSSSEFIGYHNRPPNNFVMMHAVTSHSVVFDLFFDGHAVFPKIYNNYLFFGHAVIPNKRDWKAPKKKDCRKIVIAFTSWCKTVLRHDVICSIPKIDQMPSQNNRQTKFDSQ